MSIVAIDPGSARSAVIVYAPKHRLILRHHLEPNTEIISRLRNIRGLYPGSPCVCELTRPFAIRGANGNAFFPAQLQDTAVWVGRFWQAWGPGFETMDRRQVKAQLLGQPSGNDTMIRDALFERFGGHDAALGSKQHPGPLRGITRDRWAALAVAVAWEEIRLSGRHPGATTEPIVAQNAT